MKEGKVDPATGQFSAAFQQSITAVIDQKNSELDYLIEEKYLALFTGQPYEETTVGNRLIDMLLVDPLIKQLFHLN